ncbi:Flp pilus assembly protein CpaB [Rhodoferax ferrireducens]|uniref:Flp pilus assembly protein CpaB n=1 Tax=Rhodoferax ferrireducens TaxID=192843 RepID=UPI000E0D2CE1|nr:Flp pilus assembly protein CpaB [Rhodoferax ferrireducens]
MAFKINKNWIVLLTALGIGALAAFGAKNYLGRQVAELEARDKNKVMVQVVVAKSDLAKGSTLSSVNMATRAMPKEWAHSGALTPDQFDRANGSVLAYPASAGEPLIWAQLERQRTPTFSARLTAGRRAVTVPVDEISSLSGMVEPGDLIDIVVSVNKDKQHFTFTLLQSVAVLATGTKASQHDKNSEGRARTFTTITLDTTPDDAKRVIAAREIGRVTALLRAPNDSGRVSGQRTDALALLGLASGVAAISSSVPVIYGGKPITEGLQLNARAGAGSVEPPQAR